MDFEKLQKANDLGKELDRLEKKLQIWKKAERLDSIDISHLNFHGGRNQESVSNEFVDFEVLKTLTISAIEKRLQEVKNEFEQL